MNNAFFFKIQFIFKVHKKHEMNLQQVTVLLMNATEFLRVDKLQKVCIPYYVGFRFKNIAKYMFISLCLKPSKYNECSNKNSLYNS